MSYLMYAYDTGSGTGSMAELKVSAVHSFELMDGGKHTLSRVISVDAATNEVRIGPPFFTDEFM